MSTLGELETLLGKYKGVGNTFSTQLNLVRARLIEDGSWPGMTPTIEMDVFTDFRGFPIVTLPRQYTSILRGYAKYEGSVCRQDPMGTSGVFNEGQVGGAVWGNDFQECPGYYCVFQGWTGATLIRFKFERSEAAGTIYIAGTDDGDPVWTVVAAVWEKREAVAFTGTTTVTTVNTFDAQNITFTKPVTLGRVSVYSVDSDGVETLVAVLEPAETFPQWRRYRVPCQVSTSADDDDVTYACIVKLGYIPVTASGDQVVPNNTGALRFGLQAILKEDSEDFERSRELWAMARERLIAQTDSESEGTTDRIEIEDDFEMAAVGRGL